MKKNLTKIAAISSMLLISNQSFAEGPFADENFSASMALTTNYLFRGISLSDDHPAVSASVDWGYNGFYAGIWGSSLEAVETESMEIDFYAGYVGEIGGFSYSIDALYYFYPGQADDGEPGDIGDLNYLEYGGSLAYTFAADSAPTVGISILHSPDFYGDTGTATAYEASFGISLPYGVSLGVHYGMQDLDDAFYDPDSYNYYGVNLSKTVAGFDLTLGYSDTDSDGEAFQGSSTSEIVFTIGKVL